MQMQPLWPAKLNAFNTREDLNKKSAEGHERWSQNLLDMNKHKSCIQLQIRARKWKRSIPSSTILQSLYSLPFLSVRQETQICTLEQSQRPVGSNRVGAGFVLSWGRQRRAGKEGKWSHRQAGSGSRHVTPRQTSIPNCHHVLYLTGRESTGLLLVKG